jgi:lysine 2,3-aminomutase
MSHRTGKIEIIGIIGDEIYLKYHEARDPDNFGKLFKKRLTIDAGWLDDLI